MYLMIPIRLSILVDVVPAHLSSPSLLVRPERHEKLARDGRPRPSLYGAPRVQRIGPDSERESLPASIGLRFCGTMVRKEPATKDDILNAPAYPMSEAARYLRVSPATLRSWFIGRPYPTARGTSQFQPLLKPAGVDPTTLSFSNLIEAHVL